VANNSPFTLSSLYTTDCIADFVVLLRLSLPSLVCLLVFLGMTAGQQSSAIHKTGASELESGLPLIRRVVSKAGHFHHQSTWPFIDDRDTIATVD